MAKLRVLFALPLMMCGALLMPHMAAADDTGPGPRKAEIMARLHEVEQALARGDGAQKIAKMLYAENVLMVGEGEEKSSKGMAKATSDVQGWLDSLGPNGGKTCKYSIPDPVVASATTFSSFVLLHCKANPPVLPEDQELRMMYSWEKSVQGWRVVLEMWAPGKF